MVTPGRRMVFNRGHPIPATTLPSETATLAGQIDYSAVVAEGEQAGEYGGDPPVQISRGKAYWSHRKLYSASGGWMYIWMLKLLKCVPQSPVCTFHDFV